MHGLSAVRVCLRRRALEEPRRACRALRKLFLEDGRIVGFSLAGDIHAAGVYRSLMLRRVDIRPFAHRILDARPGAAWLATLG